MSAAADTLYRHLAETLQADDRLTAYILIDPMLWEPLDDALLAAEGCTATVVPVNRDILTEDQKPRLIQWRPQATQVLATSLQTALDEQAEADREAQAGFAIGGWLVSEQPADTVAHHLARIMHLMRPTVGRRYVRWADRRVLEWLWSELTPDQQQHPPDQQQRLMGPIEAWWTLNRRNETIVYRPPKPDDTKQPLKLTQQQWSRADQCQLRQSLLRGWHDFEPQLPKDYLRRANDAIESARSLGLDSEADVLLFSAYLLQVHPQLDRHPLIRDSVARAQRDQRPLADVLDEIPDPEGWDRIREELDDPEALAAVAQRRASA